MLGVCLLYTCIGLLASLTLRVIHCHPDNFTLDLMELFPCQETEEGTNVTLHRSDILAIQANLTLCNNSSWNINQYNVSLTECTRKMNRCLTTLVHTAWYSETYPDNVAYKGHLLVVLELALVSSFRIFKLQCKLSIV